MKVILKKKNTYFNFRLPASRRTSLQYNSAEPTSMSSLSSSTGMFEPPGEVRERDPIKPLMFPPSFHENGFFAKLSIWKRWCEENKGPAEAGRPFFLFSPRLEPIVSFQRHALYSGAACHRLLEPTEPKKLTWARCAKLALPLIRQKSTWTSPCSLTVHGFSPINKDKFSWELLAFCKSFLDLNKKY